jgi:hypothetical protein
MKTMRLILLCTLPGLVQAQWTLGPPTYDYLPDNPLLPETLGVQPPVSTRAGQPLDGFDFRGMREYMVQFTLSVPLAELQAVLPPGFVASAPVPGAGTASIYLIFVLGQVAWWQGFGVTGPYSYAFFFAPVYNTALGRPEMVQLAIEVGTPEQVEIANAFYGPGVTRLAEIEEEVETEGIVTRFRLKVKDHALGLNLQAEAFCPYPINLRTKTDPDLRIWRFTAGKTTGPSFRQASQSDYRLVTLAEARAKVEAKDGFLHLPGGSVRLLGLVGPTVSFNRNSEGFRRTLQE